MKISGRNADSFARDPDPNVCAVLVYGPDSGLVGERAATLARASGVDPEDPFAATALRGEDLAGSPGRLLDEAAAIPWGGGIRVVRVRGASDALAPALSALLERPPEGAFVVIEAGDLGPRSRVRRLFEDAARGRRGSVLPGRRRRTRAADPGNVARGRKGDRTAGLWSICRGAWAATARSPAGSWTSWFSTPWTATAR